MNVALYNIGLLEADRTPLFTGSPLAVHIMTLGDVTF
jgi:hypothetical protein